MQEVIDAMQADCREVAALRDELDVLRPAATKLNKAEVCGRFPSGCVCVYYYVNVQATNARLAKQVADMDELAAQLEVRVPSVFRNCVHAVDRLACIAYRH